MHRFAAAALVVLAVACQKPATTEAKSPEADGSAPVARFTGGVVTAAELDQAIYDQKKQALDNLVLKKLIEAKAKAEGITPEAFVKREVQDKVPVPPEAELKAYYESVKKQNPGPGFPPFEAVKDRIAQGLQQQAAQKVQQDFVEKLMADGKVEILLAAPRVKVAAEGPSKGPADAAVTIIEFSDFQCPYCVRAEETVTEIMKTYDGKVKLVFRDFPLEFHPNAQKAAEAAHCAGDQGKYWELHGVLFKNQQKLAVADLKAHAKGLGLDAAKFDKCLDSGEKAPIVAASQKVGKEAGVTGTPAFFVNGVFINGAQPFSAFKQVIDKELAAKK